MPGASPRAQRQVWAPRFLRAPPFAGLTARETEAFADLIVVDGDPLADLSLLTGQGRHLQAIMQNGDFHKNELQS